MTFLGWNVTIGAVLIGLLQASVLGFGEELGWRGYLLPQLRRTRSFFSANSLLLVMWFAYHVLVIFVPACTRIPESRWVNLVLFAPRFRGFSFFVGALWEKHRDVWVRHSLTAPGTTSCRVWPLMFASASPWIMGGVGIVAGVVTIAIAG